MDEVMKAWGISRGSSLSRLWHRDQRLTLLAFEPGDYQREIEVHRRFATARVAGEWFRPTVDLVNYIGALEQVMV